MRCRLVFRLRKVLSLAGAGPLGPAADGGCRLDRLGHARPNWLIGWLGALGLCEVDFALLAPARAQGRGVAKVPEPPPRVPGAPGIREELLDGLGGSAGRRAASVAVVLEGERAAIHRSVPAFLEQHVSWVLLAAPAVLL